MASIVGLNGKVLSKANEKIKSVWYEPQQKKGYPGTIENWPKLIAAPHTPNARLLRREGNRPPTEVIEQLCILGDEMGTIIDGVAEEAQELLCEVQAHILGLRKGHKSLELFTSVQELLKKWSEINERG